MWKNRIVRQSGKNTKELKNTGLPAIFFIRYTFYNKILTEIYDIIDIQGCDINGKASI